jgi:CheY-like chemotaxis protein
MNFPNILIVDDDKDDQQLTARLFKRSFAFCPTYASSFPEARQKLQQQEFDIVVLDGRLPDILEGGFGYQLIPDIQRDQSARCIILMISGQQDHIDTGLRICKERKMLTYFGFHKHDIKKDVKLNEKFELVPIVSSVPMEQLP